MSSILFFEQKKIPWFKGRKRMRALIESIFKKEKTALDSVQFIFMSDDDLLAINQQFLKHDYYTDIITFDLSPLKNGPKLAEIYISIDRVEENAQEWNVSKINELRRVMVHGCLHLCGYKDKLNTDKAVMRQKEDFYLSIYQSST